MYYYEIVKAGPEHVAMILSGLRREEAAEITGMGFRRDQIGFAVLDCLRRSIDAGAAMLDGEIAGIWGITGSLLSADVGAWLVTTDLIARHPVEFIRRARQELCRMAAGRKRILAECADFHTRGLRFLKLIGFEPYGSFLSAIGEPYTRLEWRMNGN